MTHGRVFGTAAILAALLVACIYPTDKGDDLRIEVSPIPPMIRGDSLRVEARLLSPEGTLTPNARFVFSSADKNVAVVTTDGLVIAVNAGATTITVRAVGTEATPTAEAQVAVNGIVSVDSLRPLTAKWGQVVSLYGAGLGPIEGEQVVTIDDVPVSIVSFQPDDAAHPERFGVLQVLAAPPLLTDGAAKDVRVVVSTPRGAGALVTPLTIEPVDIFEPNTLAPGDLGTISGPREFPGLAMEASALGPSDIDWYTFTTTASGDWTIDVLVTPFLGLSVGLTAFPSGGVQAESLQSQAGWYYPSFIAYYPGRASSAGQLVLCRGRGGWFNNFFKPGMMAYGLSNSGSGLTLTLRNLPAGRHDLMLDWAGSVLLAVDGRDEFYRNLRANQWAAIFEGASYATAPVRYDLVFQPGVQSGPVPSDSYEPNDFCEDARPLLTLGPSAFTDSVVDLTFDGNLDHDWFSVDVQTAGILYVEYRVDGALTGDLVSADADSAVVAGEFFRGGPCGEQVPRLTHQPFWEGCPVDGAPVQPGPYYLFAMRDPPGPAAYQLVFSWAPGGLPASRPVAGVRR